MVSLPQKRWADLKHDEVQMYLTEWIWKFRLANMNINPAPEAADRLQGQDYIATFNDVVFAARVRGWNTRYYFDSDFTIRYKNQYGKETEWQKLLTGRHPPYYGIFLVGEHGSIEHGKLVDFAKVHDQLVSDPYLQKKALKSVRQHGSEQGKEFIPLRYNWFSDDIVIDSF